MIKSFLFIYITSPMPDLRRFDSEKYFLNPNNGNEKVPFPSIDDPPSVELSVVVPSYNEEERLPIMLDEALLYLENRQKEDSSFTYEIIVVDDGSKDKTSEVALEYCKKWSVGKIRVLTLAQNRGKGGAVRLGVFSSRGRQILFADADGATKFADYTNVYKALQDLLKKGNDMAIVCGSRAHLQAEAVAERSFFRTILMYGFHFLVWFLCVRGIQDTQCGFKLLSRKAASRVFTSLHVNRWAFDVELLYIAQCLNIPIAEVAVNWQEIDGSKMVPVFSWIQMGKDILLIRLRYLIGAWKINDKSKRE
ncbi:dolichyl-phosphate beta-glucosyltransferase-like isoform X2 [Anneissia japonica]|uniref:dolichyl-phosphate beta-glucosyltransferase-like isoform X2 n=1 Tax=Anneissia japonica TaxID=1529436 RepID=UPI00142576F2|nr:dolichyl-phosphate beta-glucosyltransferase-like isoform X2 [Anneissia japonica]